MADPSSRSSRSQSSQHASKLLALKFIGDIVSNNQPISALVNRTFDTSDPSTLSHDDLLWLKSKDLQRFASSNSPPESRDSANKPSGRLHFDEASLPFPQLQPNETSIYASKLNRHTNLTVDDSKSVANPDGLAVQAPATDRASSAATMATAIVQQPAVASPGQPSRTPVPSRQADDTKIATTGSLSKVAPPVPEDEANFNVATNELLNLEASPPKPAKTVHLPPKDVQEDRLREQEADKRHKPNGDGGRRLSHLQTQGDLASSPSSTVGAYSAATPMLPQDSPDTSPGSESAQVEVPHDLRPSPEEQRAKEEHDRQLEAQKEIARREALGDVNTPDDQLHWEEREAAARSAEERSATDANGPEPDAKDNAEPTEAESFVKAKQADRIIAQNATEDRLAKSDVAMIDAHQSQADAHESDDENITVTQRTSVKKSTGAGEDLNATAIPKVQDGLPIIVEPPSAVKMSDDGSTAPRISAERDAPRRRRSSPEPMSPRGTRHGSLSHQTALPTSPQTPRPMSKQSQSQYTPSANFAALASLKTLKGAADDPERDYLEPLFRIQAHDSPSIKTNSLPDLLRSSTKTVSTEDHFTSIHERMDYRMLRRIYQLQNANKWSFRQMEKCREPPQPVTHHDNMMAEMKWMCKDFRAERKMKKSVCAWLAQRCADWVAASSDERKDMQVKVKQTVHLPKSDERKDLQIKVKQTVNLPKVTKSEESAPDLVSTAGDSPNEDDGMPSTPRNSDYVQSRLVVDVELLPHVKALQEAGSLKKALHEVPEWKPVSTEPAVPIIKVSKFTQGKVLPKLQHPSRKRSRFDYEDEDEIQDQPGTKRSRDEVAMPPEDQEIALFHPENKAIRDRLHANNAFRPPSEFQMPSTPFYEFRNGSQWVWEDDQKLRKLAKDYSFNWSLIADEMNLPSAFKSGMERRTPWECFERWVDLEQLPAEMRKTVYFKTWYQRLEHSQQAVERRYQAQVAAMQQAQQNSTTGQTQPHMPVRRRTQPTRVEKRKTTRYLWVVDAMRKLARKREAAAFKQAESQRAAAQRKSTQQNEAPQPRGPMPTPQEFSKTRYERDLQMAEVNRQRRQKMLEAQQQRNAQMLRAQQGIQNAMPAQQRPQTAQQPQGAQVPGQHPPAVNGQMANQQRPQPPMAVRNGHLAVPHMNAQGVPQAHMRQNQGSAQSPDMQRMAHANNQNQNRPAQYPSQQYPMPNGNMASPGVNGITTSQQLASNQALLAAFQAQNQQQPAQGQQSQQSQQPQQQQTQQQGQQQGHHQTPNGTPHVQGAHVNNQQQMSASPSMPPPPTPAGLPQQLSSGHVPAVIQIKNQLRARYPQMSEIELTNFATEQLKHQSQSSGQMRQNAMNAAAGIGTPQQQPGTNGAPVYNHSQSAYQNNGVIPNNGTNGYAGGSEQGTHNQQQAPQQQVPQQQQPHQQQQQQQQPHTPQQQPAMPPQSATQQNYAQIMRQRTFQQMRQQPSQQQQSPQAQGQNQSPNTPHAQLSNAGSPRVAHSSPHMNAASPHVVSANASPSMHMAQPNIQGQPRPPSRSHTPQQPPMQRLGSSGGVPGSGMQSGGVQSPGGVVHGSPRPQQTQTPSQQQQQQQQQQTGVAR
jgi:chromatin modification-related protein VID21